MREVLGPHSPAGSHSGSALSHSDILEPAPRLDQGGSTRVGHAVTWLLGWLPGQETMEPHTSPG